MLAVDKSLRLNKALSILSLIVTGFDASASSKSMLSIFQQFCCDHSKGGIVNLRQRLLLYSTYNAAVTDGDDTCIVCFDCMLADYNGGQLQTCTDHHSLHHLWFFVILRYHYVEDPQHCISCCLARREGV